MTCSPLISLERGGGALGRFPGNPPFLRLAGIIDLDEKHETVQLRFGQRVCPFLFNGVLRGQDEKRRGQGKKPARHRHAMLLHGLQKGGLRFGRRAVDFIRQDNVGEDGTFGENKGAPARLVGFLEDVGAGDVGRHQVRRELNAVELQGHHLGQGIDHGGFGQAGHSHQQRVPSRQDADEQLLQHLVLTDDHFGQLRPDFIIKPAQLINGRHVVVDRRRAGGGAWGRQRA